MEDGTIFGGLGTSVMEYFNDQRCSVPVTRIGIPDKFIEHGTQQELYAMLGMDAQSIADKLEMLY